MNKLKQPVQDVSHPSPTASHSRHVATQDASHRERSHCKRPSLVALHHAIARQSKKNHANHMARSRRTIFASTASNHCEMATRNRPAGFSDTLRAFLHQRHDATHSCQADFVDRVQQAGRGYVATLPAREHNIQGLVRDPNNQSARPPAANPLQGDIRCRGKRAGGLRGRFGAWEGAAHLLGGGVGAVYVLESSALPEVDLVRRRMLPVPELRATATPSCLVGHCSPPFLTARGLGRQRHRGGGCHHQELQCSNADLLFTADPYDLGSSTKLCTLNTYI